MNNFKEIYNLCREEGLSIKSLHKKNKVSIVEVEDNKFVIKKARKDNRSLYDYLEASNFQNFIYPSIFREGYEFFPYKKDYSLDNNQKRSELIYLMSLLHNKTTFYRNVNIDLEKEFYEKKLEEIKRYYKYLEQQEFVIRRHIYMSPSEYLFIRNLTLLDEELYYGEQILKEWLEEVSTKKTERICLVHGNLKLEHLIKNDNNYLISFEHADFKKPIYDIYIYLLNEVDDYLKMLNIYEQKYPLTKEELLKLMILLLKFPILNDKVSEYECVGYLQRDLEKIVNLKRLYSEYYKESEKE